MMYRNASAPVRPVSRTLAAIAKAVGQAAALAVTLMLAHGSFAVAQQAAPTPAPAAKPKPAAPAPAKKPAAPAQPAPAPAPEAQQPAPAPAQGQAEQQMPQFMYSPWTKFCLKNPNDPNAKQVCYTGKDARLESGMPVGAVVIVEPEGEPKKALRITLPLHMLLIPGTRVIIDQNPPLTAPFGLCIENGCMAEYEATPELINKMKKGQVLYLQAINQNHQPISLPLPLADFGKVYDGPPSDPNVLEEQQKKLQDELQRRADEARKRLESQPQSSTTPPAPPQQ
jgi:invasion protein IalB